MKRRAKLTLLSGFLALSLTSCGNSGLKAGDIYEFGQYPQSKLTDSAIISALASAEDTNGDGWLDYDSEEYAKAGDDYYVVEPIKWRVLDGTEGLLLSLYDLQPMSFYKDQRKRTLDGKKVYANNYQYSNLRAWLNGLDGSGYEVDNYTDKGFIDLAFTSDEKSKIKLTAIDNTVSSTGVSSNDYVCENTSDKVFALSLEEVRNSSELSSDESRIVKVTDYAVAIGTKCDSNGNGNWWMRSVGYYDSYYACQVNFDGADNYLDTVDQPANGVRPALKISFS